MYDVSKINKADVENAWKKFIGYTQTAEQHEFPSLAAMQFKMEPYYNDLLENWDDRHAEVFMKGMGMMFQYLGI